MKADCHVHMLLDGADWKAAIDRHRERPAEDFIHRTLETYRALGYTYLRDGGDRWGVGAKAREIAGEYGITYRTPLSPLYKKGHYGAFIGRGFSDLREFAALAEENKKNGADFLKIMISGLMNFDHAGVLTEDGLTDGEIREMIHIGKDLGFSVMAHANGNRIVTAAAEAGVDSVEHGAYLGEEALAALKEAGTVWVPTMSAVGNLLGKGRFPDGQVQKILDSCTENVRSFAAMGGLIACGSDAGAWAVPHGAETEMMWLEKALGVDAGRIVDAGNRRIVEKF